MNILATVLLVLVLFVGYNSVGPGAGSYTRAFMSSLMQSFVGRR